MPIDASCVEALTAIADGDLSRWRGLPACSRADVAAALGGRADDPSRPGEFGYSTLYAARGAAPYGVTVWFDGDRAMLVQINLPALAKSVGDQLGAPEATADSRLGELIEQRVFASRGLTAHVQEWDGKAIRIYGYAPMTAQAFLASPWATVSNIKDPDRQ